jgi:hypothetical protein
MPPATSSGRPFVRAGPTAPSARSPRTRDHAGGFFAISQHGQALHNLDVTKRTPNGSPFGCEPVARELARSPAGAHFAQAWRSGRATAIRATLTPKMVTGPPRSSLFGTASAPTTAGVAGLPKHDHRPAEACSLGGSGELTDGDDAEATSKRRGKKDGGRGRTPLGTKPRNPRPATISTQ